jgi:hypothetical protein
VLAVEHEAAMARRHIKSASATAPTSGKRTTTGSSTTPAVSPGTDSTRCAP